MENFPITGTTIESYPGLIQSLAFVKQACALANRDLGLLDEKRADAIELACSEIREGKLRNQFVVDVIQGGAGTSTNMNANEVIANRALEILGFERGNYKEVHPLEHVNMSQSTNDVYPTAVKLALRFEIDLLVSAMEVLRIEFDKKAKEFVDVLKIGRTQLQDAVPMTLGQEFSTYAVMLMEDQQRLREAALLIQEINLGATAIGTGINAPPAYAALACKYLSELTGFQFITADNLVEATQDAGAFVQLSGVLKRVAVKLSKVCNDLRLLSSGPRAGFGEINLPPVQAGSSIMPGKVNPVIPEVVNQIAFEVIGNDVTVTFAAEAGQLQLNAFEPIIAHNLFKSLTYLRQGCLTLAERCVCGITANRDRLDEIVTQSIGIVTALNPHIGYENASAVAREAYATGKGVAEIVLAKGLLTKDQLADILRPENLTQPR
jgi:aspartate ammonia-lyase